MVKSVFSRETTVFQKLKRPLIDNELGKMTLYMTKRACVLPFMTHVEAVH